VERVRRSVVRDELAVLRDHGLTMTRSFFHRPDFMPTPTTLDEVLCEPSADSLQAHREARTTTIPAFIVDHLPGDD